MDIEGFRVAARKGHLDWRLHALEQMAKRGITREEAVQAIFSGELIEDYHDDRPFPSALFLGRIEQRPIHIVGAYDPQQMKSFIITAYEPTSEQWDPDFKTRRKNL